uniref:Roe1_2 protein n=1 Tax=Fopius arisanus TaxID=64838 RepID=A0A0C9R934_9HYME
MALPVASRFLRLSVDNFYQISRKTILRSCNSTSVMSQRYGTAPEQNAEASEVSELSENEKKLKSEMDQLGKEILVLRERNSELDDKYKRALADGENLRMRLTKQIEDAKLFGIQGFCKDLLDVADILGKATESVPKDELTERNPHLKTLYEGLRMTESQLHKVSRFSLFSPETFIENIF